MLRGSQTNYVLGASRIIHRKSVEVFILSLILSLVHTFVSDKWRATICLHTSSSICVCVCVSLSLSQITVTLISFSIWFFRHLQILSESSSFGLKQMALLYWPRNDRSSELYSVCVCVYSCWTFTLMFYSILIFILRFYLPHSSRLAGRHAQ